MKNSATFIIFLTLWTMTGCTNSSEKSTPEKIKAEHVIVYSQTGRFAGWPANCGAAIFPGDEIVTGFIDGEYKLKDGHNIEKPYKDLLARSVDGGKTWSTVDPDNYVGDFGEQPDLKSLNQPINFQSPRFMMRMVGTGYHGATDPNGHFFYSMDAGNSWEGPFGFGQLVNISELKQYNLTELTPRTDYIVTGEHECILFISAREKDVFGSDRLFCVKTTDGGQTFDFLSWVVKPFQDSDTLNVSKVKLYTQEDKDPYATQCRAVMSSSLLMDDGTLISAIRRKYIVNGGTDRQWLDLYASTDDGKSWQFRSMIADTGPSNGNPPAMEETNDGRLCVAYGDREDGKVKLRYSRDKGSTWSDPKVLMDGFWSEDMGFNDLGYPRLLLRGDGSMLALFYYSTKEHPHHIHAAIWNPSLDN